MIADDVLRLTHDFRAEAESLMVDTATITRPGGAPTFDPNTGQLTPAAGTVVYTGPCRLRQPTASESETLFGEASVTISRFIAVFPHDVDGVEIGDVITITVSEDPDVLSRQYKVTSVPLSTFSFYKGFPAEVIE